MRKEELEPRTWQLNRLSSTQEAWVYRPEIHPRSKDSIFRVHTQSLNSHPTFTSLYGSACELHCWKQRLPDPDWQQFSLAAAVLWLACSPFSSLFCSIPFLEPSLDAGSLDAHSSNCLILADTETRSQGRESPHWVCLVLLFSYLLERPEMLPFSYRVTPAASDKMTWDSIRTII